MGADGAHVGAYGATATELLPRHDARAPRASRVTDDWVDLLFCLLDAGARFLVVGAHAMAVHGVPRGTQDLDVWIDSSTENADRVWRALNVFGAPLETLRITRDDFTTPSIVVQLGLPPSRVDLMTGISGVREFTSAWERRVEHPVRGRMVPFLGRAELITNKRAAGRTKDLADLEELGER